MQQVSREQLIAQRRAATADFEAQLLGQRDEFSSPGYSELQPGNPKQLKNSSQNLFPSSKGENQPPNPLEPEIEKLIPERLKNVDRDLILKLGLVPEAAKAKDTVQEHIPFSLGVPEPLSLCRRIPLDSEQLVESLSASTQSYSKNPLSKFGQNILESMGWKEGKIVGKNQSNKQYDQQS